MVVTGFFVLCKDLPVMRINGMSFAVINTLTWLGSGSSLTCTKNHSGSRLRFVKQSPLSPTLSFLHVEGNVILMWNTVIKGFISFS